MRLIDLTGQRFGRWSVLRRESGEWLCRCDCGTEHVVAGVVLRRGTSKSCGCLRAELGKAHAARINASRENAHGDCSGGTSTPEYNAWFAMRDRCTNPRSMAFAHYGGRGIRVCERWAVYKQFLADVGRRPSPKHSLERVDHNGHYEPENVRWATSKEQNRNRRDNRTITIEGETLTLAAWVERFGMSRKTFYNRLGRGLSEQEALVAPVAHQAARKNFGLRNTWAKMKDRCSNPNNYNFKLYGGRGISICDAWRTSFENFAADVGPRPSRLHTLDRIDPDGDYCPGNVRWATKQEQARNTRFNRIVELSGEKLQLAAALERCGMKAATFYQRVRKGWSEQDALTKPLARALLTPPAAAR